MKEIGGYFELELARNSEYYADLVKLNSARNAFKYILKVRKVEKCFIPIYICNSIIEPLEELQIDYEFYNIQDNFEICQEVQLKDNEMLLYVNYFALKSKYINSLATKFKDKLVIDNTQAFFEKPIHGIDTIYSPRKFFGVSDGGYLYIKKFFDETFEVDESYSNSMHLLGRIDKSASSFYKTYLKAEERLINQPIKEMSKLTQRILASIDYEEVMKKRVTNFKYLHQKIGKTNLINFEKELDFIPFVYPLRTKNKNVREILIEKKIYIPKYWHEVLARSNVTVFEKNLVNEIIPLPIDQRYSQIEMDKIINIVKDSL